MLKIDNSLLEELGLGTLPDAEKNSLLRHIYETLEMRVGMRLADQMTNEQLDEFEQYFEAKDDAGAFKWLETNFPNYKDIVQEEFDKLKAEVGQSAPQILSASQANAQNPQAAVQPQQPQVAMPPQPMAATVATTTQPAAEQPLQGPNTQQPAQPFDPGVVPQAAPAPAQPYMAPPVPPAPAPAPMQQPLQPQPPAWQPPIGTTPPPQPPISDTPQQ